MPSVPALAERASRMIPDGLVSRLATELKLSETDAGALARESARFLALASRSDEPLVPSELVDEAWHQWLLHSRSYFTLCAMLGVGYLHHEPARPGDAATDDAYEHTRRRLAAEFGPLPERWWGERSGAARCTCGSSPN